MKIAVLSDVHGNLPPLQAVLADVDMFQPEALLFAGDFTRGPHPNEVIDLLREREARMILGNDDLALLRYVNGNAPEEWCTCQSYAMLRWTAERISRANIAFLQSLPEQSILDLPGMDSIQVVHGSPRNRAESLSPENLPALDRALEMAGAPVLVCGHSHVQWCLRRGGRLAVNPGAVSGTLIGPKAQYARMSWDGREWQVDLRTLDYDMTALRKDFENRGLLAEGGPLVRGYLLSLETSYDFMMAFLKHAHITARQHGWTGGPALPDDLWQIARETFSWEIPDN